MPSLPPLDFALGLGLGLGLTWLTTVGLGVFARERTTAVLGAGGTGFFTATATDLGTLILDLAYFFKAASRGVQWAIALLNVLKLNPFQVGLNSLWHPVQICSRRAIFFTS